MRHTVGSASSAALRVASSPLATASASAKIAGSFLGARPSCETATMRLTARSPSLWMQRTTASAFSCVSAGSLA